MAVLKRALILALTAYLVIFADRLTWYFTPREYFLAWQFYVVPFVIVAAGLILGWLCVMIIQYSKWIKSFYLFGLNTVGIALIALVLYLDVQTWSEGFYKATHPSGRYSFHNFDGLRKTDLAHGFDKFYALMPPHTRIGYMGYLFTSHPVPGSANDTIWTVYYCYHVYPDSLTARMSKVEIHDGRIRLLANSRPALADSTYCRLAREYNVDKISKLKFIMEIGSLGGDLQKDSAFIRQAAEKQLRDTFPWKN